MAIKIKPADTWFSKCVREASDWTCEKCETVYDRGSMGLHNSHIFSRRHRTIRWCSDNTQALCFSCHQWFGGNPADSGAWVTNLLGDSHMDLLREKRDSRMKVTKADEKDIAKHYKAEYERLLKRRSNGETGRLDFDSYQ